MAANQNGGLQQLQNDFDRHGGGAGGPPNGTGMAGGQPWQPNQMPMHDNG